MADALDEFLDAPEPGQSDPLDAFLDDGGDELDAFLDGAGEAEEESGWGPTIAGLLASVPPSMAGAKYGGMAGTALAPFTGPLAPFMPFLGAAVGSGIGGGLGYRTGESLAEGKNPLDEITPGGMAMDAAVGVAVPAALRGVGRGIKAAAAPIFQAGFGTAEELGQRNLSSTLQPLVEKGQGVQDVLGKIPMLSKLALPAVDEGPIRKLASVDPDRSARWRVAWRALSNSPFQVARAAGQGIWIRKQAEHLIATWAEQQPKLITKGLSPRQAEAFEKSFRSLGKRTFRGPLEPELEAALDMYGNRMDDVFNLKRVLGIMESTADGYVPIRQQGNYVLQKLAPHVLEAEKAAAKGGPSLSPDHARWLDTYRKAHGLYEQERMELPEEMLEQAFLPLWEGAARRDMDEIASAVAFGGGAPAKLAAGGLTVEVPPLLKQTADYFREKGRDAEASLIESTSRQLYARHKDPLQSKIAGVRSWTANALLTDNFLQQLGELWKGSAFGGGVSSIVHGMRLARGSQGLRSFSDFATRSDTSDMLGEAAMSMQKPLFGIPTPVGLAKSADRVARKFGWYSALSMTDRVARVGNGYLKSGEKIPAALLKEAEEVMGVPRGGGAKALRELAGHIARDGVLPPDVHAMAASNLVNRWHYNWGPGLTPEIAQEPIGSLALQLRSYMFKAWGHFADDVGKPIAEGYQLLRKEGDASLLKLGVTRFMRSVGHQIPTTASMAALRQMIRGQPVDAKYLTDQILGGMAGMGGTGVSAVGGAVLQGDPFQLAHMADVPALSKGAQTAGDLLVGAHRGVADGDWSTALRGAHTAATGFVPHLGYLQGARRMMVGK